MKRGRVTRRGFNTPSEPPEVGASPGGGEPLSRGTQRGLGDSQPPKLVTMHGVAPPSDSDRPAPLLEAEQNLTLELGLGLADVPERPFPQHAVPDLSDVDGFDEPSETPFDAESEAHLSARREQFRTAPGGGKNRVSGGRASAAAYVSPSALLPGHGREPKLRLVEVDDQVFHEARSFQTEPSLSRRGVGEHPSESQAELPKKGSPMVQLLIVPLLLGALFVGAWVLASRTGSSSPQMGLSNPQSPSVPSPSEAPATMQKEPKVASPQANQDSAKVTIERGHDLTAKAEVESAREPGVAAKPLLEVQKVSNNASGRPTTSDAATANQNQLAERASARSNSPARKDNSPVQPKPKDGSANQSSRAKSPARSQSPSTQSTSGSNDLWLE